MSRENVFGLPVHVDATAEMLGHSEPMVYAVARCADLPVSAIPPRVRMRNRTTPCDNCREMCWYDPKYIIPGVKVLCMRCLPPDTEIRAQRAQVDEIREMFPWA